MQTCPHCRAQQLNGVLFCSECGASLIGQDKTKETTASLGQRVPTDNLPPPVVMSAPVATSNPTISLVIINNGRRLSFDSHEELLVGRKDNARGIFPDVDLGLDGGYEAGVSRRHAVLSPSRDGWLLEDLGSANGTFINGTRIPPEQPTLVRSGDEIKLGTLLLRIEL